MTRPKIISMYLPQYYETEENNQWWGKGFTEWTAVRAAEQYSDLQYQPKVPLHKNYYNLLDKSAMLQQSEWMKQYNVYGQCFYHYWFKNGKRVLEKPAENLLKWQDIEIPFCFSWANESWTRTWSNIDDRNSWADKFEHLSEIDEADDGMLLEQSYGNKEDWREHFLYLLPFFQDDRYIRIEDKPLFIFYKPGIISCLEEMIAYWNELACENGLAGIYVIGTNTMQKSCFDAIFLQEPQNAMKRIPVENVDGLWAYDYDAIWRQTKSRIQNVDGKTFFGGVVDYDTTPRRGKSGLVFIHGTPEKFKNYLQELLVESSRQDNEYIFINAWNEWGEGMYLEPDEKNGYAYLEAVRDAQKIDYEKYTEILKEGKMPLNNSDFLVEKYKSYWKILNRWLSLKEQNRSIAQHLMERGIGTVGIYGFGELGNHLVNELADADVEIVFGLDRKAESMHKTFPVYLPNAKYPKADVVIVTLVGYEYEKVKQLIQENTDSEVISLEQLIYEI